MQNHLPVHALSSVAVKSEPVSPVEKITKSKYPCSKCPAIFNQRQDFDKHFRRHDSGEKFKCRHCSYATSVNWARIKHEAVHKTKKVTKSGSKPKPSMHSSTALVRTLLNLNTKVGGRKKYSLVSDLLSNQDYQKLLTGNPNFTYKTIYKTAVLPGGVRKKVHTYKCEICPQAFRAVRSFLTHSALHGADHKYKCHLCNYSVFNKMTIANHLEAHAAQTGNPEQHAALPQHAPRKHVATKSTSAGPRRTAVGANSKTISNLYFLQY